VHFAAAVAAGKHVFMEKPVAVDPAGVRAVLAAGKSADARGLSVVAGTQRRHERCYLDLIRRVRDGELGTIHAGSCAWNQGGLWVARREQGESDIAWQCRNWLYFCWLSGDHIVEQHIHNLDVMNWALGAYPVRCTGMGGRQVRTQPEYGHIFDHFAVEYEYASGAIVSSQCRQIDGCDGRVDEVLVGSRGRSLSRPGYAQIAGLGSSSPSWTSDPDNGNPYVQEHIDLLASIRNQAPRLNDAESVAKSTLTAIMGRMSAYTGKSVTWEQAMESTLSLMPENLAASDLHARVLPAWAVPVPGRTPLE
jgi:predicted dehydrogenase